MKKIMKRMTAFAISTALALTAFQVPASNTIQASAATVEDDAVSLKYVSTVAADTAGSTLRIYGDADASYSMRWYNKVVTLTLIKMI